MRKLYALLAGFVLSLAAIKANPLPPDVANFTFTIDHLNKDVTFTNTSVIGSEPGLRKAHWTFGDGSGQWTAPLAGTQHHYQLPGTYTACLKIYRYRPNANDSVLAAQVCKTFTIQTVCAADFEKLTVATSPNPLHVIFKALPSHNGNQRPVRICWTFGDGRDTCIQYSNTNPGPYTVPHIYTQPGLYEVCVKIVYAGGCEARKCKPVQIGPPDSCSANFERLPITSNIPNLVAFKALPWHNNNKKPVRICWTFGDGRDTCINYPATYTGTYTVAHRYNHPGLYEVCVKINYAGGCEARKCKPVQIGNPDTCGANFERLNITPNNNPLFSYFKALPSHNNNRKPARVCWTFGDGRDTCINYPETYTGQYAVGHQYSQPGLYEVCVKINYYGGCEARKCKPVQVGRPDTCRADFERLSITPNNYPHYAAFKALPDHNNNRKPARVCWSFGDGTDTCINYPETYTGLYTVGHRYSEPGLYEVCVKINYYGGCEARKCKPVQVGRPDSCRADFERIPITTPAQNIVGFKALPWHNNNKKPQKICWRFGDGTDTCINYPTNYTGTYTVAHRYNQPGQYQVCVRINYYGGCEAQQCRPIVIPPPVDTCRVRLFEITPSITSLVRGFFAVPSSTPERRPIRVCYDFGDGTDTCIIVNPQQPPVLIPFLVRHTYPAPGQYRACVKVLFVGGCVATDCKEVIIRPASNVCGGYMTDSLTTPRTFKFKGFGIHNPNDEVIGYRWSFGDGSFGTGREITHTYNQAGNYEVCLTIKTRLGCETRICKTVRVPGNNQPALTLTPNPVQSAVTASFQSTHTETVMVRVINSSGNPVLTYTRNANAGPNTWTFNLTPLVSGVYSMVVQSPNQLASAVFIKL